MAPTAQDKIQDRVEASDPDNERVRLDYEWVVDGKLPSIAMSWKHRVKRQCYCDHYCL